MESVVSDAKTAYDAEVAAAADTEAQVKKLAGDVKEAMEGRVKGPKSHVDKLAKQITKINGDITKTNVAIKTAGRNIVASEEKIENIKKDIAESKGEFCGVCYMFLGVPLHRLSVRYPPIIKKIYRL